MMRQNISKQIWELKYRDKQETEIEYYERVAEGLFGDLTSTEKEKYAIVMSSNADLKTEVAGSLRHHFCSLAGRGMFAIGTDRKKQTFSNCFVLPIKKDSMQAIMETALEAAMTMKSGGGVGYSISILRPAPAMISTSQTTSSGAVSFLKIYDATCGTIKAGNSRRGAQMCAMGIWHPDIKTFITAKRQGDLKNFNMSVFVSDEFMKAKAEDGDWDLIFPDIAFEKYDEEWDGNIKLWKEKGYPVVVYETVKARELWNLIMESNYKFAEPGVLFEDTINNRNTLYYTEYIQTTNPCVTADTLVTTDQGDITIKEIIDSGIENYKVLSYNLETGLVEWQSLTFGDKTRENTNVIEIEMEDGEVLKLTPDHKVFTENRGYVEAAKLTEDDIIVTLTSKTKLKSIKVVENADVYDITVDKNHNFFANKILIHNCGEQPLYWYSSCNLGPVNLSTMVDNPFTDAATFNWDRYKKTIQLMTIMLDRMLDKSYYPLPEQAEEVRLKRLIGLGFTGLGDMFSKLKIRYDSEEAIAMAEEVTKVLSEHSYLTSAYLAEQFGKFPSYDERILESYNVKMLSPETQKIIREKGLRNSRMTSIAPVGTISLIMNNCSSGIEPNFALEYTRKIKANDGSEFFETVETDAWNLFKNSEYYDGTVPEYFQTAQDLKPLDHIRIQAAVQKWICTAVSKTTNCPVDITFDDFKGIYDYAYESGLKGCTTYRPNDIIGSVLEVKKEEKSTKKDRDKEQKEFFDIWKNQENGLVQHDDVSLPAEYPMKGYKIKSEGKKWYIHVAFKDKQCTKPFAIFASTNNRESEVNTYNALEKLKKLAFDSGISANLIIDNEHKSGSQTNVIKVCRAIGMLLRHNVPIINIVKTLDNVDVPISSFVFRMKKFLMMFIDKIDSNGTKCPECDSAVEFRDGCISCPECFWSKCS